MTITSIKVLAKDAWGNPDRVTSADGRYSWRACQPDYIVDSVQGRSIYQMGYMRKDSLGADDLPDDVEADVRTFWKLLRREYNPVTPSEFLERPSNPEATTFAERALKAAQFDRVHNEGGEGFNPYRGA